MPKTGNRPASPPKKIVLPNLQQATAGLTVSWLQQAYSHPLSSVNDFER